MEVRPGYKRTEVGVIPEEWAVKTIGEIADVGRGRVISQHEIDESLNSPYPVYSSQTANSGIMGYIDTYDFEGEYITWTTDGVNAGTVFYRSGRFNCTNVCGTIKLTTQRYDVFFVSKALGAIASKYVSRNLANPKLMNNVMKKISVPLPPLSEQRAIAEVLSDVDALIAALDRLIAKKRAIKQGAMQQLLTGKTRLPGFSGSWDIKRLDNVAEIYNGGTPSTNQSEFWDGDVVWCTPTDVTALDGFKYLSKTARTITALGLKASSAELIPAHSIVMTSRATIGECAINTVPVATNQGFKSLVPFQDADVEFLYYLLQTKKRDFLSMCSGSTFPEISKSQVAAFEIELPAKKTEQSAIAAVLSDMDAEIAALEARRDKTRALKQGMMQELLTGRTRLV